MKFRLLLSISMLLWFFYACNTNTTDSTANTPTKIDAKAAMKLAENYIVEQGFTEKEVKSLSKIKYEEGEFSSDTMNIVKMRKNTLEGKAVAARTYGEKNDKWAVGFRMIPYENNLVRVVTIDSIGKQLTLQKQHVREDWVFGKE